MKTLYIVQGFSRQKKKLVADTAIQCTSAEEALRRAEKLSQNRAGVIAASQKYDEATEEYGEVVILAKYGEVPEGVMGE